MRFYKNFDPGHGSQTGRWLYLSLSFSWWHDRNRGPGNAVQPGTPCGHRGLNHCNSIHCTRFVCRVVPRLPFVTHGANVRVWCGPTYNRGRLSEWVRVIKGNRRSYRSFSGRCYKLIDFRM